MAEIILFDYWRSSASYRVRIALNLKGLAYRAVPTNLLEAAQKARDYVARNPQGKVPMLSIDGLDLTQSLAIIDYLDSIAPEPRLIPAEPLARARCLQRAMMIVADLHPKNNTPVLKYLREVFGADQAAVDAWYRHWIVEEMQALEVLAPEQGLFGGNAPDLTDLCLVPQMYNARRFATPMEGFPKLARIDAELCAMEAFQRAAPEAVQPA